MSINHRTTYQPIDRLIKEMTECMSRCSLNASASQAPIAQKLKAIVFSILRNQSPLEPDEDGMRLFKTALFLKAAVESSTSLPPQGTLSIALNILQTSNNILRPMRYKQHLGEGSFEDVFQVEDAKNTTYALKIAKDRPRCRELFIEEYNNLLQVEAYPNFIKILHFDLEPKTSCCRIWMECLDASLFDIKKQLTLRPLIEIFIQITSGLNYLHKKGFIHRDIKTDNILLDKSAQIVKIGDLSFMIEITGAEYNQKRIQPMTNLPHYPPEYRNNIVIGNYTGIDIWSFGILMTDCLVPHRLRHLLEPKKYTHGFTHQNIAKWLNKDKIPLCHNVLIISLIVRGCFACLPHQRSSMEEVEGRLRYFLSTKQRITFL
jgi:serine/threonine protein kinase